MTHPDIHTLTGAFATNALDEDERAAFEAHLPGCPACQAEVDSFLATAAMLGSAVGESPPAGLRDAIMDEIGSTRQLAPGLPSPPPSRSSDRSVSRRSPARRAWFDRLLLPAAAAMAVVVAGMAIMVGSLNRRIDELATNTADVAGIVAAADMQTWEASAGDTIARVVYSPTRGEGVFLADGMGAAGEGRTYELWLIDADGVANPAGLFDATGASATHTFTGSLREVAAIGVTIEPASGSPAPTSDPIMVIEL